MDLRHSVTAIDRRRTPGKTAQQPEATPKSTVVDEPEHSRRIAEAAYFIAERRGFAPGGEIADWLQAESEIANSR